MDLPNRPAVESAFANRLARLSDEEKAAALVLMGNPRDPSRIPESFWLAVEARLKNELDTSLAAIFLLSMLAHGYRSDTDLTPQKFSGGRAQVVSNEFVRTSRQRLAASETPEETLESVFGRQRMESIAVTETTAAASAGGEYGIARLGGLSTEDTWYTEADGKVCAICSPLHATTRDVWAGRVPSGPPAHPRCRCWIRYIVSQN